jgi:hypothetical protein
MKIELSAFGSKLIPLQERGNGKVGKAEGKG